MCAKQLYVKSNGTWVAAGGAGGSVDTTGLATEQFVTDAISAIPATDLSGLATLADLNDALATIPEAAITVHDGAPPQPTAPIPQALEEAFESIDEGLHFFKGVGALVTVTRQQYQTTIVINGPSKSVAKIVKSEAGLPTPENPSMLVQQEPDGKWMKMTSPELDKPFGPPQMVDIFATATDLAALVSNQSQFLTQQDIDLVNSQLQALATVTQDVMDKVDTKADKTTVNTLGSTLMASITEVRADTYTKPEVDAKVAALQQGVNDAELGVQSVADQIPFVAEQLASQLGDKINLKADKATTYTKQEVDDKLEADKDFSIANDNVLLASITSLQEVVANLGTEIGTGQIDVLDAIRGVEIEPSAIKFTESVMSPIKWKGGLSLAPTKEGDTYHLAWNNGKDVGNLLTSADLSDYALLDSYGQVITASQMKAETFVFTKANTTIGYTRFPDYPDGRLGIQINGPSGEVQIVAYVSDLSGYAKKADNTQNVVAKVVTAQGYGFGDKNEPPVALTYTDTGEGYNERLVLATASGIDYVVMKSDLDELQGLLPRMERLEGKTAPVVDLSPYVTQVDADAKYELKASSDLLRSQTQAIFDSIYTRVESDARYVKLADADAKYGTKESLDLLRSQTQIIFDSVYTRQEADARYPAKADVYTQKQTEDRFIRIEQAFSKADFDNQMALFLYSRKQVDDKLAAISPLGSPSINDPALADFKKSVLDSVALMLAGGGKQPPADIGWTKCRTAAGTADSVLEVRMIGGVMEFKGTLSTGSISGSQNVFQLPASFPTPELTASYPIAARLVGSNAVYTYINFTTNSRLVGVTMAGTINEITISGLRVKAAY